jgi:predicted phage terminase large subunit-like protein
MKGGAIVLIQCMTGDTPVLMASGNERPLKDVRPGDLIATYEGGKISTSKVLNWKNQGPDCVYAIKTTSGTTVKANARHPFLVQRDGAMEWIKLKDLSVGDLMVRVTGASGGASNAKRMAATSLQEAKAIATHTITNGAGEKVFGLHRSTRDQGERLTSGTATELTLLNTTQWSLPRMVDALSATNCPERTSGRTGAESFALITATTAAQSGACSATIATLLSGTEKQSASCLPPLNTYETTLDAIEAITPCGHEDVYDIQVDRTENFIANGLVSHNTRWHEDDLDGRLLEAEAKGGDKWEKLILPAIMSDGTALWPDEFDITSLTRTKAAIGPRDWSALYQQEPSPDDGTFFLKAWFKRHAEKPTERFNVYMTSDYAVTEGDGDYTEHGVWGVTPKGRIIQLDWWHGQTSSDVWIEEKLRLIRQWKPICAFGEAGVIQKAIEPMLRRRMTETGTRCRMEWVPSIHDKATRARGFQSRAAMGEVSLLDGDKGERVLKQLLTFPAGKHDDAVDVCSLMGMALDMAHPAIVPLETAKEKAFSDYRSNNNGRGDSWRV